MTSSLHGTCRRHCCSALPVAPAPPTCCHQFFLLHFWWLIPPFHPLFIGSPSLSSMPCPYLFACKIPHLQPWNCRAWLWSCRGMALHTCTHAQLHTYIYNYILHNNRKIKHLNSNFISISPVQFPNCNYILKYQINLHYNTKNP